MSAHRSSDEQRRGRRALSRLVAGLTGAVVLAQSPVVLAQPSEQPAAQPAPQPSAAQPTAQRPSSQPQPQPTAQQPTAQQPTAQPTAQQPATQTQPAATQPQPQPQPTTQPVGPRPARAPATPAVVVKAEPGAKSSRGPDRGTRPRYHHAPINDQLWRELVPSTVLMQLNSGQRVCVYVVEVTTDEVFYEDIKGGRKHVKRSAISALHENSWECDEKSIIPKKEWARAGVGAGLALATLGTAFAATYEAVDMAPYQFVPGLLLILAPPPMVWAAGRSAAWDLRVSGIGWARWTGWGLYAVSVAGLGMWLVADVGKVEALDYPGHTVWPAAAGLLSTVLFSVNALRARKELKAVRARDSEPPDRASRAGVQQLGFGVAPMQQGARTHGFSFGVSGRF